MELVAPHPIEGLHGVQIRTVDVVEIDELVLSKINIFQTRKKSILYLKKFILNKQHIILLGDNFIHGEVDIIKSLFDNIPNDDDVDKQIIKFKNLSLGGQSPSANNPLVFPLYNLFKLRDDKTTRLIREKRGVVEFKECIFAKNLELV